MWPPFERCFPAAICQKKNRLRTWPVSSRNSSLFLISLCPAPDMPNCVIGQIFLKFGDWEVWAELPRSPPPVLTNLYVVWKRIQNTSCEGGGTRCSPGCQSLSANNICVGVLHSRQPSNRLQPLNNKSNLLKHNPQTTPPPNITNNPPSACDRQQGVRRQHKPGGGGKKKFRRCFHAAGFAHRLAPGWKFV